MYHYYFTQEMSGFELHLLNIPLFYTLQFTKCFLYNFLIVMFVKSIIFWNFVSSYCNLPTQIDFNISHFYTLQKLNAGFSNANICLFSFDFIIN